jgi:hypothetical protein
MENEEIMVRQLKLDEPRRLETGLSNINLNPIDVVEKLGKYEFIYDYKVNVSSWWDSIYASAMPLGQSLVTQHNLVKEGGSNANMIAMPTSIWSGQSFPQPVKFNSEPQVGTFSKGNIVNVVRFDGNNAIIENPNFVEADPNAPKSFWTKLIADLKNQKEFLIPKSYLRKVDDNLTVTVSTGILYGANMEQPLYVSNPVKPVISSGTQSGQVLETNVTYTISKPFTFTKSYTNVRPLYELGGAGRLQYEQTANYDTLPIGMEVTGNLIRQKRITGKSINGMPETSIYYDVLVVSGMGQSGQLEIPVEYLTKKVPTNVSTNSSTFIPENIDNKNLLMIAGAFLVGYVLFNKGKSE